MWRVRTFLKGTIAGLLGLIVVAATPPAIAAEKVTVAVFPSVSALPFYVARERGYFAAEGIDAEVASCSRIR
jgi:NitT/TauT family transport system substrate-binding protein